MGETKLAYRRAIAGEKPYGFLQAANFDQFKGPVVEQYFQDCLFWALNGPVVGATNNPVVLTGNTALTTLGNGVEIRGNGKIDYAGNYWDVPPKALPSIASN